jgi:hypothetical protein
LHKLFTARAGLNIGGGGKTGSLLGRPHRVGASGRGVGASAGKGGSFAAAASRPPLRRSRDKSSKRRGRGARWQVSDECNKTRTQRKRESGVGWGKRCRGGERGGRAGGTTKIGGLVGLACCGGGQRVPQGTTGARARAFLIPRSTTQLRGERARALLTPRTTLICGVCACLPRTRRGPAKCLHPARRAPREYAACPPRST